MICKRKCTGKQSPGERSGLESRTRSKNKERTEKIVLRQNGQRQRETSKSDRAVITEILDDEVVVDEISESSRKTKK